MVEKVQSWVDSYSVFPPYIVFFFSSKHPEWASLSWFFFHYSFFFRLYMGFIFFMCLFFVVFRIRLCFQLFLSSSIVLTNQLPQPIVSCPGVPCCLVSLLVITSLVSVNLLGSLFLSRCFVLLLLSRCEVVLDHKKHARARSMVYLRNCIKNREN